MARPLTRALACGATAAVLAVPVLAAAPAQAAPPVQSATQFAGATGAFALRLQVNLPEALAPLAIDLQIDPVTGTVSTATGTATASGQVLGSSKGLLKTILDAATPLKGATSADLASGKLTDTNDPLSAVPDALKAILNIGLIKSSSTVAPGSSTSTASVASIKLALGDTLAKAAKPIIDGLDGLQVQLLSAVAAGLPSITTPLCSSLPQVTDTLLKPLGLDLAVLTTVCKLPTSVTDLSKDLTTALHSLGDNIFNVGLIQTSQSISNDGTKVTSKASASIAGLGLLGTAPLGSAGVIQSSAEATAKADASGKVATAKAVPPVIFDLNLGGADGLLNLQGTLTGLLGNITPGGTLSAPLTTIVKQLLDAVNAVAKPLGASVITLDDSTSAQKLASCPTELTGLQTGEYVAPDNSCAAAATRGIGVEITLPAVLAGPLGITGPFVTLALSPSAAVASAAFTPAGTPAIHTDTIAKPGSPITQSLPRTGLEGGVLGGSAIAALLGAAYLRRRRSLV